MKPLPPLTGHASEVLALAFAPGAPVLASGSRDRSARLWRLDSGASPALASHRGPVHGAAFSPDGTRLATGCGDMLARVWDGRTGENLLTCAGPMGALEVVAFTPDGARLCAGWNMWSFGHISLWDAFTGKPGETLRSAHGELVFDLAFAPDGRLAAAIAAGYVRVWQPTPGGFEEAATLRAHTETTRAVAWSPDGARLATASSDGAVKLWALDPVAEMAAFRGYEVAVNALAWSPDGGLIAAAGNDGTLRLWDAAAGREAAALAADGKSLRAAAWSGDGSLLAAAGLGGTIHLWQRS